MTLVANHGPDRDREDTGTRTVQNSAVLGMAGYGRVSIRPMSGDGNEKLTRHHGYMAP